MVKKRHVRKRTKGERKGLGVYFPIGKDSLNKKEKTLAELKKVDFDEELEGEFYERSLNEAMILLEINDKQPKLIKFKDNERIIVFTDDKSKYIASVDKKIISDIKGLEDWLFDKEEFQLSSYLGNPEYNLWEEDVGDKGSVIYHGTVEDNLESILEHGLITSQDSRGLSNKMVGEAVFTSFSISDVIPYGKVILEIDLSAMKRDGFTPIAVKEPLIEEIELRSKVAGIIGYEYYSEGEIISEGVSIDTIIFNEGIPAKYLKVKED